MQVFANDGPFDIKAAYDADLLNKVSEAQLVDMVTAKRIILGETVEGASRSENYRVEYKSIEKGMQPSFFVLARRLGIMADVKAGVPRNSLLWHSPAEPGGEAGALHLRVQALSKEVKNLV